LYVRFFAPNPTENQPLHDGNCNLSVTERIALFVGQCWAILIVVVVVAAAFVMCRVQRFA